MSERSIVYNSLTHTILELTKFYRKTITINDLKSINPVMFGRTTKVERSLALLLSRNLVSGTTDSWAITPSGIDTLYAMARSGGHVN